MRPRDLVGVLGLTLLAVALLTSHIPTAVLGGALLLAAITNADRTTLRRHARDNARDTEGRP